MNEKQKATIRFAYLDLIGAKQARDQRDMEAHEWDAHVMTIEDLEMHFPDVLADLMEKQNA
jgi:hypothetical protein